MKQLRKPDRQIKHIEAKHLVVLGGVNHCCVVVVCGGDHRDSVTNGDRPCNRKTFHQTTTNALFICWSKTRNNSFHENIEEEKKRESLPV